MFLSKFTVSLDFLFCLFVSVLLSDVVQSLFRIQWSRKHPEGPYIGLLPGPVRWTGVQVDGRTSD